MKAYGIDLRKRVVKCINEGGSKVEAARRFGLGRRTFYRYLAAAQKGMLAPKTSWGHWRKPMSHQLPLFPQRGVDHSEEATKAMAPVRQKGQRYIRALKTGHRTNAKTTIPPVFISL
jgi:transposase-like protein